MRSSISSSASPPVEWSTLLADAVNTPGVIHDAYSRFWSYSSGNQLLAWFQCVSRKLDLGPINTFLGWIECGRHVKKGEKALTLCMPVTVKRRSDERSVYDPLATEPGDKPEAGTYTRFVYRAQRKSPSFSVNLKRKCFNCFGCNRGGNCLDFAIYMEGKDPENRQHVREVALLLQERFHLNGEGNPKPDARPVAQKNAAGGTTPARNSPRQAEPDRSAQEKPSEISARPVIVNAPLDFELRGLDPKHPYLKERGFSDETILHFGLGFCNRGLMQGRVVIPLRDQLGKLIGYAGRFTRDDQIGEKVPKYLFPGERERNGTTLQFHKSLFLYNGHSIKEPVRDLVVVEGFPSVWWLHQCGFEHVVALMGNSCSDKQAFLIRSLVSPSGRVWLMPDAGEGGEGCAESVLIQVAPHRFVHWVKLGVGQPTDLSPDDLVQLLDWKVVP